MSVCRPYRGAWLEKLNTYFQRDIRTWIIFLVVASIFCACSGIPVQTRKDYKGTGVYHRVKSGENLNNIAKAYHVDVRKLVEVNNIPDPNRIEANSVIFIPDATQIVDNVVSSAAVKGPSSGLYPPKATQSGSKEDQSGIKSSVREIPVQPSTEIISGMSTIRVKPLRIGEHFSAVAQGDVKVPVPESVGDLSVRSKGRSMEPTYKAAVPPEQITTSQPAASPGARIEQERPVKSTSSDSETESLQFDRKRFIWPLKGKVVSRFGIQPNGMYYNGITLAAGEGSPVAAAAGGTVIYSGPLKDYGETIIIKHEDHYATVYTRLGTRKAKIDDRVKQSDLIGQLGKAEEKGGMPHLNFEIRYQNKARNPMLFLP